MGNKKRQFACAVTINGLVAADCFFDVLGSLVIVLDTKGTIRLFNSGAEEMLGYKSEEAIGKNWINKFVPQESRVETRRIFDDLVRGRVAIVETFTNEILNKSGERLTAQWHSSVITGDKGKIEGVVATAIDITKLVQKEAEIKRLEADTLANEQKFRAINQAAKDPIIMMNSRGLVVSWNKAAEKLFGVSEADMLNKNLYDFFPTKSEHEKIKEILNIGNGLRPSTPDIPFELSVRSNQGKLIEIELMISRVKLFDEWHSVGLVRDITERRAHESDMKEKMAQLENINRLMIGRELRMIELKEKLNKYEK